MKRSGRFVLVSIFVHLCFPLSVQATTGLDAAISSLDAGIQLLEAHDPDARSSILRAAAQIEESITQNGYHTVGAYHALGNAYALSGDLGRAMLSYRRAELIDPRDPKIKDSIAYVQDQVRVSVEPSMPNRIRQALVSWRGLVSRGVLWAVGFSLYTCAWVLLIVSMLTSEPRRVRLLSVLFILVATVPIGALGYEWRYSHRAQSAVILWEEVNAMSGPDDAIYDAVYAEPLVAGVEGRVMEIREGWAQLRMLDATVCWVPQDAFELVRTNSGL